MSRKQRLLLVLAGALPMLAHHQFSAEFDRAKAMTLTGSVTAVEWSDPHVFVTLNATGNQTGEWRLEGASAATLSRMGWTSDTIKRGDRITVEAYAALKGENLASARAVTLADGRKVSISDADEDGGPRPVGVTSLTAAPSQTSSAADPGTETLPRTASPVFAIAAAGLMSLGAAFAMKLRRN